MQSFFFSSSTSLRCIALVCCAFLWACSSDDDSGTPAPTATFTSVGNLSAGCTIAFTNSSQNAQNYLWNFGDGSTSAEASPSHTFTQGGTYTVTLTATGPGGTNTSSQSISVAPAPSSTNTGAATVTNNGTAVFVSNTYTVTPTLAFMRITFTNQSGNELILGVPPYATANEEFTYALVDMTNNHADFGLNFKRADGRLYVPTTGNSGQMKVTFHDTCAKVIRGTFSGQLKYTDLFAGISDPMLISNGTFDISY